MLFFLLIGAVQAQFPDFDLHVNATLAIENANISLLCEAQLRNYLQGIQIKKPWALEMLDAGARIPPPGYLTGNEVDLGNFDECVNVESLQLKGKYCIAQASFNFEPKPRLQLRNHLFKEALPQRGNINVQLAKCFPNMCSAKEMEQIYQYLGFNTILLEDSCQVKSSSSLNGGEIAVICVLGAILTLVILSTSYHVVLHYTEKETNAPVLLAFSLMDNVQKLLKTSSANHPKEITCLHGLRVLSTAWIILDHRYSIQFSFPMKNSNYHSEWVNSKANMFMLSATLAVDTFLLLSGMLIVYNFLGSRSKGHKFNIILHYLHRYLRLTPVLIVVMIFHMTLLYRIGSGPLWKVIQGQLVEGCQIHWWKTLLYVQNVFGRGKAMCISQTWYLSLDMQLFLLSPFLLVPLGRLPRLTLGLIGALAVLSSIASFLLAWFYELNAYMQGNQPFDKQMDFVWLYYFPFHTRAGPWLIGLILGYIVFEFKEGKLRLPQHEVAIAALWMASLAVLCVCVFVGHNLIVGDYNKWGNSFHIALVRPVWVIGISWIILACVAGYGDPVNWFLSLPIFQVVSKLTYTLYVVHYTVIYVITAQMRETAPFSNLESMYKFWGDLACAYVISLILTLAVEFPMATIDRRLLGRMEGKKNNS